MATLTGTTVVVNDDGMPVLLRKGEPLPEWAVGKVGAHLLDGDNVEGVGAGTPPVAGGATLPAPPPKVGTGSATAAWVAYAQDVLGMTVELPVDRPGLIARVEADLASRIA
jgi:hypothetical protein